MIELLMQEVAEHGDKAAIVPVHRLQDIRQDLAILRNTGALNNFQQFILSGIYQLDVPVADFELRSIIVVASPSAATIEIPFTWQGNRISLTLPASYVDKDRSLVRIESYLRTFLQSSGHHVLSAPQLPRKRIAVRSGLAAYGRNNITYVEGMGSFINLNTYFSDIPCLEDLWQEVCQMDLCQTCQACLRNCPTGAILPTSFLIDNERCLTYFNEGGGEWDFPNWIEPSSHHTLYGCLRCQAVCPANKRHLKTIAAPVEFSEEDTAYLLEGKPFELYPQDLKQKVKALEMTEYLSVMPRNLKALFNNE